jgi:hypothetical protein
MAFAGRVAGASGFRSIAWSYGREGGNRSEAFSLNTFANCRYSVGSKTSGFDLIACSASFDAIVCRELAAHMERSLLVCWSVVLLVGVRIPTIPGPSRSVAASQQTRGSPGLIVDFLGL